jgi:CDGSH-type Zn-finger protein
MCGLSGNQPFCDGSHKKTAGEEPGKVYVDSEDLKTRTEFSNSQESKEIRKICPDGTKIFA